MPCSQGWRWGPGKRGVLKDRRAHHTGVPTGGRDPRRRRDGTFDARQRSTKVLGAQVLRGVGRKVKQMPLPLSAQRPENDQQLVFTSSQAALYLGVSLATVRRWTDAGHIGCYRTPGGQRRFSRDQLEGFIDS